MKNVIGIYFERSGAYLIKARVVSSGSGDCEIGIISQHDVPWDRSSQLSVRAGIDKLKAIVSAHQDELTGLGVACYGPFTSPGPGKSLTQVHPKVTDEPLRGLDLFETFSSCFKPEWFEREDTAIRIETDAAACAIGEAHKRGLPDGQVLAYLLATEGIGVGLVRGRNVLPSALHPEIGLLPAYPIPGDPIAKPLEERVTPVHGFYHFESVAELANNDALRKRFHILKDRKSDPPFKFRNDSKEIHFWDLRARYLALACVACVGIVPPHKIVVAPDIDPLGDVDKRVWEMITQFRDGWITRGQPLLMFDEFADGYISKPLGQENPEEPMTSAVTGAIGLCHLAARDTVPDGTLNKSVGERN